MNNQTKKELIKKVIVDVTKFQILVKINWEEVDPVTMNRVTKEYLTFLMYCVVYMLQNNDISNGELDDFTRAFYQKVVKDGFLKKGGLLDYEKLSRQRFMNFYQILSEGTENDQLNGKRLNALIAKEVLYIQNLLSGCVEKKDVLAELYPEIFSVYSGLMLEMQLMLNFI